MQKNNLLDPDVDLATLAKELKNFTGAEIETLVKRAASDTDLLNSEISQR